jgi:ArsR family transcriptional regulator
MTSLDASVGLLGLLADPTRLRLLALLGDEELSVAELVSITELAQSRVSSHLGRLREAGLLRVRPEGTSTFYALNDAMPGEGRRLWELVRSRLSDRTLESDRERRNVVVKARAGEGGWLESVAGEMERHYSPGRTWEALAHGFLGFAVLGDVLDIGSGDGFVAGLVARRARSVTCLDRGERMIDAAKERLRRFQNTSFTLGDMHDLPFQDGSFDQVLMFNVLPYSRDPASALSEAARVLRKAGSLSILTLAAHSHEAATAPYGHVQSGFEPRSLRRMLTRAGLSVEHCDVAARERRAPHFEAITAYATKKRVMAGPPSANGGPRAAPAAALSRTAPPRRARDSLRSAP